MADYIDRMENILKRNQHVFELVSYEWDRCYSYINKLSNRVNATWYTWSAASGLKRFNKQTNSFDVVSADINTVSQVLDAYFKVKDTDVIFVLEEANPYLTDNYPVNIRALREAMRNINYKRDEKKFLILLETSQCVPSELSKELEVLNVDLPDREILGEIYNSTYKLFNKDKAEVEPVDPRVLEACLGLTTMEARNVFSACFVERGKVSLEEIDMIIAKKSEIIKKSGLLEFYPAKETINSVGGLDLFKDWIKHRSNAYTDKAREFNLPTPKGVLLLGIPGCGKSLSAKAVSNLWKFPLLKLDMGKMFGGIVGESEKNIRHALDVAKAISPCILWIDEIEKGLSGIQSSGSTDGGTAARVFGTLLTWLQEKTEPVFVIATANGISQLPPELLRKGRFDEIFFIDLPNAQEREEIFKIHINKVGRDADKLGIDLKRLAEESKGYSGAEIECAVSDALFVAFDSDHDLSEKDILDCLKKSVPLSSTMEEQIESIRSWSATRARKASSDVIVKKETGHKLFTSNSANNDDQFFS